VATTVTTAPVTTAPVRTGPQRAAAPPSGREVCLTPPAVAMAWVGQGRPHEAVAVPGVVLADGDLLVTVELATVCGSDVHTVQGHRPAATPLVLGHEYVGRVHSLQGEPRTVDGVRLREGDRVVWSIMASCRTCDRCMKGLPQKCRALLKYGHERIGGRWELNGGFATHVHLRAGTAIVKVDDSLPAEVLAPATCGTATAWAAVDRADDIVDVDDAIVLVLGAGLIGLTASAMAADRGARVIVADPEPARRELALRFGAVSAVDPRDPDQLIEAVVRAGGAEVDVVIEASGSRAAVVSALETVGVGGVVVLVGSVFATPSVAVDPELVVRNLVTVRGVHNYGPRDLAGAVNYLHRRSTIYPFAELTGDRYPLSQLDDALAAAARGEAVRVAVDPTADATTGR
jgi:putative phosphonate catabolism associated alcohol dehydrogenase